MSWEDKLNRINALFDVWIDVQRRWVYLDGIFSGSADIQHLLPVETQKFQRLVYKYFFVVLPCYLPLLFYVRLINISHFLLQCEYRIPRTDEESRQVVTCNGCCEHSQCAATT